MGELLVGTTLLVSFLGGTVALLAPRCVSLPAYLATGFRRRGGVLVNGEMFGYGRLSERRLRRNLASRDAAPLAGHGTCEHKHR